MITIISLRACNEKDLKGKERVVPPGIEIPGIPARKLVNVRLNGLPLYAAPDPDNADRVTAALASDGLIPA